MRRIAGLCLICSLFAPIATHAAVLTVGAGAGYNHSSMTAALSACADGDTILVAAGTYSTLSGEAYPLVVSNRVALQWATAGVRPTVQGDGTNTVLLITTPGATVRGLHITGGVGSEGIYGMDGGGICIFVDAEATGAVWIDQCLIEGNTCPLDETYDGSGGGIYCGGTFCTCFEIGITDCVIRNNTVPGNGAGVFCGLLSKVWIEDCLIELNVADDRGGGVCLDSYAISMVTNAHIKANNARGDQNRTVGWGGKGGGIYCAGEAVCQVVDSEVESNTAAYFGGGVFTLSSLRRTHGCATSPTNRQFFTVSSVSNLVEHSYVARNRAGWLGGGVHVREPGFLAFRDTWLYRNDAGRDGGGVHVGGDRGTGGRVEFTDGCLLEGNECVEQGGGVLLASGSSGSFSNTRFLGNTSGRDGGAAHLDGTAQAVFAGCLVSYNNAARGYGGGLWLGAQSRADLAHCSVVGSFAPWGRSGIVLDGNALASVTNSILWRNAGGSVELNTGTLNIGDSLNEDGATPAQGVITGTPGYVGWGTNATVYVQASAAAPGNGTAAAPYPDLQTGLDSFSLSLGAGSPCIGTAGDGGNMGAATGVGGSPGVVAATLDLAAGGYDIRGRNIICAFGMQGAGATSSVITNAVFGYIEHAFLRGLGIVDEYIFGGAVIRGNAEIDFCRIAGNHVEGDGGGLYVCPDMIVTMRHDVVENNTATITGAGVFLGSNVTATVRECEILANGSLSSGGGVYGAEILNLGMIVSTVSRNTSGLHGAGLLLGGNATIDNCEIADNDANKHGGGIFAQGWLSITNSRILRNAASRNGGTGHGGGAFIASSADVRVIGSLVATNYARNNGGGLNCDGDTRIRKCVFEANDAERGGALTCSHDWAPDCADSLMLRNYARYIGGAVFVQASANHAPSFRNCRFEGNFAATYGGVIHASTSSRATFDECQFATNTTAGWGGCLDAWSSSTLFWNCTFTNHHAAISGGTMSLRGDDVSRLAHSVINVSTAQVSGGAIFIDDTAGPLFDDVIVREATAGDAGGGISCHKSVRPVLRDVEIVNCESVLGGGFYADGGTSTFKRCWFRNNTAWDENELAAGGGARCTQSAAADFLCCWFGDNFAKDDGGAISADGQAAIQAFSTFLAENQALNTGGGAHFRSRTTGLFQNCTIVSNKANFAGGGAGVYPEDNSQVLVESCVVYGNDVGGVAGSATNNAVVRYSCLQEQWGGPGTGNMTNDPMLLATTYQLGASSTCIDAGNPAPSMDDGSLPPGQRTSQNDMGATGGPYNSCAGGVVPRWFISEGAPWQYDDRGQEPAGDWKAVTYDDYDWGYGRARLGYGGDGEVTTVDHGTNAAQRHITTYFRRTFSAADLSSVTNLELRLVCDDGAVVYLNGTEVARHNMPVAGISFPTLATTDVMFADEQRWFSFAVNAALLTYGTNVVVAEVHQVAPDSVDLGFDLQLATPESYGVLPRERSFYVNDDSKSNDVFASAVGNDGNTGLDPRIPMRTPSALFAKYTLAPGDVIYLDTGVYTDSVVVVSTDGDSGFSLVGAGMDVSIIDGNQLTNCMVLDRVPGVTVRDLTLRNGNAARILSGVPRGGALQCTRSGLWIENVALRDSRAYDGGGAWVDRGEVVMRDLVFSGNQATNWGGGLCAEWTEGPGSRIIVTNCVVTNNRANIGGGLAAIDATVQSCTIDGNVAAYAGGGGYFERVASLAGCRVQGNRAKYGGGLDLGHDAHATDCVVSENVAAVEGGGTYVWDKSGLRDCTFSANTANHGGGAAMFNSSWARDCVFSSNTALVDGGGGMMSGSTVISGCVFVANAATNHGGGANLWDSAAAHDCTFQSNRAQWGGGVSPHASVRVVHCGIVSNTASLDGGGAQIWDSAVVSNCTFLGNAAGLTGGGANLWDRSTLLASGFFGNTAGYGGGASPHGEAQILDCVFSNNAAVTEGGGVRAWGYAVVSNCSVRANRCDSNGGGAYLWDFSTLRDSTFFGNVSSNMGAGIYAQGDTVVTRCTVAGGRAAHYGGGLVLNTRSLATHCTVSNNTSGADGGGARVESSAKLRNCLVADNAAANRGGGVSLWSGSLEGCTVVDNTAGDGGGLYMRTGSVSNSIVYFNNSTDNPNCLEDAAALPRHFSQTCVTPAITSGVGNISSDPLFADWGDGDYRLTIDSPCIDAGRNQTWMSGSVDLDGNPRIQRWVVDMGAYEFYGWNEIPASWLENHGLPTDGTANYLDGDGDGYSTIDEYTAMTDPNSYASHFCIVAVSNVPPVTVYCTTATGRFYRLRYKSELTGGEWSNVLGQTSVPGTGGLTPFTDTNTPSAKYYRMNVWKP